MSSFNLTSTTSTLATNNPSLTPSGARSAAIIEWAKLTCPTWASTLPINTSISWAGVGNRRQTQTTSPAGEDGEDSEDDSMSLPGGGGVKLYGSEEEKMGVTEELETLTRLLFSQRTEREGEEEYKNRQALQRLISFGTTSEGVGGKWNEQGSEWILQHGKVGKV
ncbi:hypothetical protein J008_03199 [Cryptococcus neoformans]|nr:hypothetical protein C362_02823 [Cryptococcus neoformans var. grubii Bt1]OXC67674.1 hypothetical protein AYX13_03760 [Cryptococcus neoformans var. grubii]OXH32606.1 hypothetical protein J008_03199 [Cryptococcus neoformans var. grubii]